MNKSNDVDAAPVQPIVLPPFGPYYADEAVTIYNADCRQVLPFLPKFDLLLTDPPYGLGKKLHGTEKNADTKDMMRGSFPPTQLAWDVRPEPWELQMMLKSAKDYIVWGGNYFCESLQSRQCVLVWDKMNGTNPMADCEIAMTSFDMGAKMFSRHHFSKGCRGKVHPTQKPLPVIQWCLSLIKDAETVVDPFAGSGTTGVACKLEGRKAVLVEISEEYCEKAADRLRQGVLF